MSGVAGFVLGQGILQPGLPDVGGDGLDLLIIEAEVGHFGGGAKIGGLFQPHGDPVPVQLEANVFEVGANFLQVLQQALCGAVKLDNAQVELAVGDFEGHGAVVEAVGFVIRFRLVGLLHEIGGLFQVVFLLLLEEFDFLPNGKQILRFLVIAFVAMTAHASALAEEILAFAESPADIIADQHYVRGVADLTARFEIAPREDGPEPVLVGAVGLLDTGGGAAIALVARRAAELVRVVNLQEIAFRMAGEGPRVFIRLFAFQGHGSGGEVHWFANAHVAGFAAVDDIGTVLPDDIGIVLADVDLADFRGQGLHAVLQVGELRGREVHHVIGEVGIHQFLFFVDRLDELAELGTQLRALVLEVVVGLFQFVEALEGLFLAVGHFDGAGFLFIFVEVPLLALFGGGTGLGLDVVGGSVDVSAAVGEDILHGEDFGAQVVQLFVDLLDAGRGILAGGFVILLELLVVGAALDFLLGLARLGSRVLQEG